MNILNKYEVLQFSEEIIDDFILLFNQIFSKGKKLDRERVIALFGRTSPYLGYIAYDGKAPIAFYGGLRLNFVYGDEIIQIAQSVNSMVHPKYRKKNLYYHLAQMTVQLAEQENIKFIFGLPNNPGLLHSVLDWEYLGAMKKYSIRIKTIPLSKICWKLQCIRPIYLAYYRLMVHNLAKSDTVNLSMKKKIDNNYNIPRTEHYLNYKKGLGAEIFSVNSTRLLVQLDYRLKIGDIEDTSLDNFSLVLNKLKRICFWLGVNEICFAVDSKSEWNSILKDRYVGTDDLELMYYPIDSNYKLDLAHITFADYDTF